MAKDHRGRDVHAGKRTNDEIKVTIEGNTDRSIEWFGPDKYNWVVDMAPTHPMAADVANQIRTRGYETTLSDGGTFAGFYPSNNLDFEMENNAPGAGGLASTPYRAAIAAGAMKKRMEEGRDIRTGRPR